MNLIGQSKSNDGCGGYNQQFDLPLEACVVWNTLDNALVSLGIGTKYSDDVRRNDIWDFKDNSSRHLFIDYIWVHPSHRKGGLGTSCLGS
jgi:hypothetical protein